MEARHKLKLLQKLLETRDDSILGIPIKVAGEDGYVLGVKHARRDAILPLAFVLPDEVGEMFMDSDVFKGRPTPEDELEEAISAISAVESTEAKEAKGLSGKSESGGEDEAVVAFMLGPEGMQPMRLPDEIASMLNGLGESIARLEKLRKTREARTPRVQQPSKDEKGGVN